MRRSTLLVLAAALLALVALPAGSALAGPRATAVDSDWVSWRNDGGTTYRNFAFRVSATSTSLRIAAAETAPWAGQRGCPIAAGTVVYQLTRVGADSRGYALYHGTRLGWEANNETCTTTGFGGEVSAVVAPGQDPSQKPQLAYGPDNVIDVYSGTVAAGKAVPASADDQFFRKSGTAATAPATTTSAGATPAKPPAWNVSGTWSGFPGTLSVAQTGSALKGTFRMKVGCLETYTVKGTLTGSTVKLALRRARGPGDAPPCAGTQTLNGMVAATGRALTLALVNAHQASPPTPFTGKAKKLSATVEGG